MILICVTSNPLPSEEPPDNFDTEVTFKTRGTPFPRFDFWSATLRTMGNLAMHDYSEETSAFSFGPIKHISYRALSGPNPKYRVKSILWALLYVYTYFNQQRHYSEASWNSKLDGATLGFGQVYWAHGLGDLMAGSNSSSAEDVPTPMRTIDTSDNSSSSALTVGTLSISYTAKTGGRHFAPQTIYDITVATMLQVAEQDTGALAGVYQTHDPVADFTFAIGPGTRAQAEEMTWSQVYRTIWIIPESMHREADNFVECVGTVRVDGVKKGMFTIRKGRIPSSALNDLWDSLGRDDDNDAGHQSGSLNSTDAYPIDSS